MDRDLHRAGQRGHVEREVGGLGAQVPGPAVLPPGVHADALRPRRAPPPDQRPPLRPRYQQEPSAILSVLSSRWQGMIQLYQSISSGIWCASRTVEDLFGWLGLSLGLEIYSWSQIISGLSGLSINKKDM